MQIAFSITRSKDVSVVEVLEATAGDPLSVLKRELFVCSNPTCREVVTLRALGSEHRVPHFAHVKTKNEEQRLACDLRCNGMTPKERDRIKRIFRTYKLGVFMQRVEHYLGVALYRFIEKRGVFPVVYAARHIPENKRRGPRLYPMNDIWLDGAKGVGLGKEPAPSLDQFVRSFMDDLTRINSDKVVQGFFQDRHIKRICLESATSSAFEDYSGSNPDPAAVADVAATQGIDEEEVASYAEAISALLRVAGRSFSARIRNALVYAHCLLSAQLLVEAFCDQVDPTFKAWSNWDKLVKGMSNPELEDDGGRSEARSSPGMVWTAIQARLHWNREEALSQVNKAGYKVLQAGDGEKPSLYPPLVFSLMTDLPLGEVFREISREAFSDVDRALETYLQRPGVVYVMHSEELDRVWKRPVVKIGRSVNPFRRAKELGGQLFGGSLEIADIFYVDDAVAAEAHVHKALRRRQLDARSDREIFALAPQQACIEVERLLSKPY